MKVRALPGRAFLEMEVVRQGVLGWQHKPHLPQKTKRDPPALGLSLLLSPGCVRKVDVLLLFCTSASKSTLRSWLFRKLQQSRWSWGENGHVTTWGPVTQATWYHSWKLGTKVLMD